MEQIRILIIDDMHLIGEWASMALKSDGHLAGYVEYLDDLEDELNRCRYDIALVDILFTRSHLDGLDAIEIIARCTDRRPDIVLFTDGDDPRRHFIQEAARHPRVVGGLLKNATSREVAICLERVTNGQCYWDPVLEGRLPKKNQPILAEVLSENLSVAKMVCKIAEGYLDHKSLAAVLGKAPKTIQNQLERVRQELRALGEINQDADFKLLQLAAWASSNREYLISWARRNALFEQIATGSHLKPLSADSALIEPAANDVQPGQPPSSEATLKAALRQIGRRRRQ
jgi:DNA-binding NarL/FixJ family response regulator